MSKFLTSMFQRKPKLKSMIIGDRYRVEVAFEYKGVEYYHFPDQAAAPAGRQFMALAYYQELQMNVDKQYLEKFTASIDKILSDPKKISIKDIFRLNEYLKERLSLMPMPDYIYRLASVMFFDNSESPYQYDYEYNQKKIEKWKASGDMLAFFLQTPLKDLIPLSTYAGENFKTFLPVIEKMDTIHREHLSEVLSQKA